MIKCSGDLRYQEHYGKCMPVDLHDWNTPTDTMEVSTVTTAPQNKNYTGDPVEEEIPGQIAVKDNTPEDAGSNEVTIGGGLQALAQKEHDEGVEGSDDGPDNVELLQKSHSTREREDTSKFDPILVAQLQRLSELIDGIRQTTSKVEADHQSESEEEL